MPASTTVLRTLLDAGELRTVPIIAFAVTPSLREWYVDDDAEALEYAALSEAARVSLRLVDTDEDAARRRVVIAVDTSDSGVTVRDDLDRGVVQITEPVPLSAVAAVHLDDADAQNAVAAAAQAVIAADLGDVGAQEIVDDAEGFELSWFANQEIAHLLDSL